MFKHIITRSHSTGGLLSGRRVLEAGAEDNRSLIVPAGAGNYFILLNLIPGLLKAITIVSDKAMLVKTNSAGEPDNVISLEANQPFQWALGDPPLRDTNGNLISATITSLYLTNGDEANAATFELRSLFDPLD